MSTYFLLEKESRAKKTHSRRGGGCRFSRCGAVAPLARVQFAIIAAVVPSLAGEAFQNENRHGFYTAPALAIKDFRYVTATRRIAMITII